MGHWEQRAGSGEYMGWHGGRGARMGRHGNVCSRWQLERWGVPSGLGRMGRDGDKCRGGCEPTYGALGCNAAKLTWAVLWSAGR